MKSDYSYRTSENTIFLYNYGIVTEIARFKKNRHDVLFCVKALNDSLVTSHGKLPNDIFYYVRYKYNSKKVRYFLDYTGAEITYIDNDLEKVTRSQTALNEFVNFN